MSAKAGGGRMRVVQTNRKRVRREASSGPLSDADGEAVVMAVLRGHDPEPVDEWRLVRALDEIGRMVIEGTLADLVLEGRLLIRVADDGELVFSNTPGAVLS